MKIAIFHDFFDSIGGGEKVVMTLARALDADVVTNNLNPESVEKIGGQDIRFINLGETFKSPPLKQIQAVIRFKRANFSGQYDFFIFSGNWAFFAAAKHKPNLYYCYTPTRILYDLYDRQKREIRWYKRPLFTVYVKLQRLFTKRSLKELNKVIAISKIIQGRILKYFNINSEVIYPGIETKKYHYKQNGDFWLSVNRLYSAKRVHLQLAAFAKMPSEKLVVVGGIARGDGGESYVKRIKKNAPVNVTFLGKVSEAELIDLYANCHGFITTALEEDFGLTPLEAMAAGKPVIAPNEGGYKETIIDGQTGVLIDDLDADKIVAAVKEIGAKPLKYKDTCLRRATEFDTSIFIQKIKHEIKKVAN